VYVSNLDYRTSANDLKAFFSQWGEISEIFMPLHPQFSRSRGFAFLTFAKPADSEKAISEMDGKEYDGRVLHVS
ncbi:hypothetical protein M885DRAFT_427161, partial [Pelagophyceae sp. CCMP2097]